MSDVKLGHGLVWTQKGQNRKNVGSLNEALSEIATCHACGCDDCIGYETVISATTGELLIRYYTGEAGGPYTEVVEEFTAGLENVKALYRSRI